MRNYRQGHSANSGDVTTLLPWLGVHEHPPLFDILLHGWLRLTNGNIHLLRLPSIIFYVIGVWIIALVAKHFGGIRSQWCALAILVLWPYGFHFGRLATWYSFCFMLVSLMTLLYLQFLDESSSIRWLRFTLCSIALVYSNYFGWAFLGCLAIDFVFRNRHELPRSYRWLFLTAGLMLIVYLPVFRAFTREIQAGIRSNLLSFGNVVNLAYNLYCIFVSESVAPWFWFLGIPAAIAVAISLLVTLLKAPSPAKAFFWYFLVLLTLLALLGAAMPKRLLLMSPWLIIPIAVTLGSLPNISARRLLIVALTMAAAVGWFGIFSRRLYAAPHWIEPWESIAENAATIAQARGVVIGDNPSFFFYLTYLSPSENLAPTRFDGLLPTSVRRTNVYTPQEWIGAGKPTGETVLLVEGLHYGSSGDPTEEAAQRLGTQCRLTKTEKMIQDIGFELKQQFTGIYQPEWRIELRTYNCQ